MERLKGMSIFAKVVELGSFTAAARQLHLSVSSISQIVAKLEDELQVKLLNRSTRSIGLTEAGKIYYQGCRRMLAEATQVHEQLYAFNNTPVGTLRIGSSSTMAQNVLAEMTSNMLREYPGLSVNLVAGIPAPDLIADGPARVVAIVLARRPAGAEHHRRDVLTVGRGAQAGETGVEILLEILDVLEADMEAQGGAAGVTRGRAAACRPGPGGPRPGPRSGWGAGAPGPRRHRGTPPRR